MNHKSWTEERQIIQWPNEPQVTNRRKTDNTMAKWTTSLFGHCINCLSSIHDLWFIWRLYYLSFFCSWLVVHLAIVLSVFLLFMTCGSFGHCIIFLSSIPSLWFIWPLYYLLLRPNEPQVMNRRNTDNTMAKWTTSHEQKKDR
jgi:hypothetical protein